MSSEEEEARAWEVLLTEALRANSEQQAALEALRGRTALLVASLGPAGLLLTAKRTLTHGWHHIAASISTWGAVSAALVALLAAVALLWPRDWDFRPNSEQLEGKVQAGGSALELVKGMTLALNSGWRKNDTALASLHDRFAAGLLAGLLPTYSSLSPREQACDPCTSSAPATPAVPTPAAVAAGWDAGEARLPAAPAPAKQRSHLIPTAPVPAKSRMDV